MNAAAKPPAGVELVKQRTDPAFDYAEELRVLEQLHRDELCGAPPR